jgi:hypothetical protein
MIIHKQGNQKVNIYAGFGQYQDIPAPLCVGAKSVYKGKSYYLHRNWKYVTCKHCLKKKLTTNNSD